MVLLGVGLLFFLVGVTFLRFPKATLAALAVALMFQESAVAIVGGRDTLIGGTLQNADEAALAALLAFVFFAKVHRNRPIHLRPWTAWYFLFLLAAAISIAVSGSGWMKGAVGIFLLSKGFVFALVADQQEWSPRDAEKLLAAILGGITIVALFAIPDLLYPESFRSILGFDTAVDYRSGLPSVVSLLGHPGGYGWLMVTGALIALAHIMSRRGIKWAIPLVLFLLAGALSLRRKPILGFLLAATAALVGLGRGVRWRQTVPVFLLLALLAFTLSSVFVPLIGEGIRAYFRPGALTTQARTALYGGALILARDHFPLGVGIGRYGSYGSVVEYSDIYYQFGFHHIHGMSPNYTAFIQDTFWPQIIGETGAFGTVFYGGALVALLLPVYLAARAGVGDPKTRTFVLVVLLINLETLVESIAAPTYTVALHAVLSLGLASIAARLVPGGGSLAVSWFPHGRNGPRHWQKSVD